MIARGDAACFVGIDLHKDTLTACVVRGRNREVSYVKIACKCQDRIRSFFASLPQPSVVAIETVGIYRWLWTELEPLAGAPPESIQLLRNWTRHRNGLTRQHAKVLHHVKSILNRLNFPGPVRLDAAALQRYLLAGVERFSVARKILVLTWTLVRKDEPYQSREPMAA